MPRQSSRMPFTPRSRSKASKKAARVSSFISEALARYGGDPTRTIVLGLVLTALLASGCQGVHDGVEVTQSDCVVCHQGDYDATTSPVHEGLFPTTCADCHSVSAWIPALGGGAGDTSDPAHDIVVDALIPRYSGTAIASVTPDSQTLSMPMVHASTAVDPRALESCSNCHAA